jgi:hypothetical protein
MRGGRGRLITGWLGLLCRVECREVFAKRKHTQHRYGMQEGANVRRRKRRQMIIAETSALP